MLSAPISFSTELCVLGPFLVATTPTGICAVWFGEDTVALEDDLAQRFASATRIREDNDALLGQVAAFIASPRGGIEATLDMQGTAFQRRVWNALRTIPAGKTASYVDIAKSMGVPTAARAVAGACAANPLAVVVPCHHVVRQNGDLSGYRWGVERKRALLWSEREQSHVHLRSGVTARACGASWKVLNQAVVGSAPFRYTKINNGYASDPSNVGMKIHSIRCF